MSSTDRDIIVIYMCFTALRREYGFSYTVKGANIPVMFLVAHAAAKVTLQHLVRPSPYRHQDRGIALASEAKRERAVVHEAEDLEMQRHKIGDVVRGPGPHRSLPPGPPWPSGSSGVRGRSPGLWSPAHEDRVVPTRRTVRT